MVRSRPSFLSLTQTTFGVTNPGLSLKPKNLPVLQMGGLKWEDLNLLSPLQQAASGLSQPPDQGDLVSRDDTLQPSFGFQPILPKIGILLGGWAEIAPLMNFSTAFLAGT